MYYVILESFLVLIFLFEVSTNEVNTRRIDNTHFLKNYCIMSHNIMSGITKSLLYDLFLSIYSVSCRKLRQKDRIYCYVLTFSLPLRQHTNTFMVIDLDPKH